MTAVLVPLVAVFVLAAVVGLAVLTPARSVFQLVMGLGVVVCRFARLVFVIGGYVVALILWGIWLCVDRRGALEAYRAYPREVGLQD